MFKNVWNRPFSRLKTVPRLPIQVLLSVLALALLATGFTSIRPASAHTQTNHLGSSVHPTSRPLHLGPNRMDTFGVSATGTVLHWVYENGILSAQEDIGGFTIVAPAAVVWTNTISFATPVVYLDVFIITTGGVVEDRQWSQGAWGAWRNLGGGPFIGLAVTSDSSNSLQLVATGGDGAIHMMVMTNLAGLFTWFTLDPVVTDKAPAIASYGQGDWDVFVTGKDGGLWRDFHSSSGSWSGWVLVGSNMTSAPVAVSWAPGADEVFVRNSSDTLSYRTFAADYVANWFSDAGPQLTKSNVLAVASWQTGELDIFLRGSSGDMIHRTFTGTLGSPMVGGDWFDLGGSSTTGYGAAGW